MRFSSILLVVVVVAGLAAFDSIAAATSTSIQEKGDAVLAEAHGGRFLRVQSAPKDDDSKLANGDIDSADDKDGDEDDDVDEDRDLIIPTINRRKYRRWFRNHLTPHAVKEVLGLNNGLKRFVKPIKRRVYKGYVVYYEEHCRLPEYSSLKFCQPSADQ